MITPSISVLSAVEGLNVATSIFKPYVLPLAVAILLALFLVQSRGTEAVGKLFGPVMLTWFLAIGPTGVFSIIRHPAFSGLLRPTPRPSSSCSPAAGRATPRSAPSCWHFPDVRSPCSPIWGISAARPSSPCLVRRLVLPALVLNYLGQGALLLHGSGRRDRNHSSACSCRTVGGIYPMVALSTAGHGHRQPGADLRRLLADPPGGEHGARPTLCGAPHLGREQRPGLYAGGELLPDGGLPGGSVGLPAHRTRWATPTDWR